MATFRFRAEAALDLRRRDEQAALGERGRAEARFREAYEALQAERRARDTAVADATALERRGSDVATLLWHRNWIVRLTANVARLGRDLDARAREVKAADDAWREARRRRMALDRLRQRALERFRRAELREEMKTLDELARIRFVMSESWRTET